MLDSNLRLLLQTTKSFLQAIEQSADSCPSSIMEVCHHLRIEVEKKFPGSSSFAVGGFIFLRLFTPAVVTPDSVKVGIVEAKGKKEYN